MSNVGSKKGRSLNPSPSIRRFCELLAFWKLGKKKARQNGYKEPTFEEWMKKNNLDLDDETRAAYEKAIANNNFKPAE